MLDLDGARETRRTAHAAKHEGSGTELEIRWGGGIIAKLPPELPLDVFAPVANLNVDVGLLLRLTFDVVKASDNAAAVAALDGLVDVFAANPRLIPDTMGAVQEVGRRLLGDDGFTAFMAGRPSALDIVALARGVAGWYGVSLGEASASTAPSLPSGTTPKQTSNGSTASTSEASGPAPDSPGS